MTHQKDHIDILIARKLSGQATVKELAELESLMADPGNRRLYKISHKAWINSRSSLSKEDILADREKIKDQIIEKLNFAQKREKRFRFIYRIAAILAVPILMAGGWYLGTRFLSYPEQNQALCEITAPKGQIAECTLADGTRVWLNSGTTIQYNPALTGQSRMINLKGEAYFKVAKDRNRPFIVNTAKIQVKVTGTSFNVRAYPGDDMAETTLEEGSVELIFNNSIGQAPVELKPGEHATFQTTDNILRIQQADTRLHTAWREGKYIFKDADLKTIARKLEELYDVRIHMKSEDMGRLRFRGMFECNANIFDAIETIEKTTSFKCRVDDRDIWIENYD